MESDLKKLIQEFVQAGGFAFKSLDVSFDADGDHYWCHIETDDSKSLIGHNGEHIQALNHLFKRVIEKNFKENTPHVTVDINNYHKNKIEKIKTTAHMMAERARFFKSKIELDPMNSFERRIVHDFVSKHQDLGSESIGTGHTRSRR
jgi:spoIIIJ-associated protein